MYVVTASYITLNHLSSTMMYCYSHNAVNFTAPAGLVTIMGDPWRISLGVTVFGQNFCHQT